ncbi:3-hydroxyacyl-ACP dehydratase FabZ family protein [Cytophagaceae bacterium DM2B3-1]|uniref:3-hydroxyacyl-ACP dehydratase FabZ family protein n=1 Tax=Xanthocytophaga flava TaxID=3048013 RepID=A0AAE3QSS5_9BACT|nr:3-hydroxyacyl-ACP dehydratase FabZ family protein [Xanthocytophaga flavus]MDJ1471370.1 3-hydroxyacyl-ACP dehydratase FabZ family protein [Xanthocytophaga flavus]MDJ1484767.1 3-hydroxyacyl-ACP dehydratase FabZ family protein [Xanthocytophaga flavus]MDJ1496752.1 3-hydroxyacyl-ACP dehydratase FabZ family protein [Xanthocytophaga flavus]
MKEIESLLPHRDPFLYVDSIISATLEEVIGIKQFDSSDSFLNSSFPETSYVPGMILIESMAQCGGAGARKINATEGLFGLAGIEMACFHAGVEFGKTVKMIIKNLKISTKIVKQSGIAYVDEVPVAEATWVCIKIQ